MVHIGTPEQYYGEEPDYPGKKVVVGRPVEVKRILEPVRYIYAQDSTDHTPLIIGVCFLGAICFLGFLAWLVKS